MTSRTVTNEQPASVRRYLNKYERQDMVILAAFAAFLENRIAHWAKLGRSKEKLKYARTCYTYANKVLKHVLEPLDEREKAKVIGDTKTYSVGAFTKIEAQREYERLKKIEDNMIVRRDDWYDMADHALVVCRSCSRRGDEVDACNMRNIFIEYDVPAFDQYAPTGVCPYKQQVGIDEFPEVDRNDA